MRIPNGSQAFVEYEKVAGYCLNPEHPRGRHKARLFAVYGITDASMLSRALTEAAASAEALPGICDEYGARFLIDFDLNGARVRSIWIIRRNEDFPRLVSCYIL